jgi:serine/threonine protein kinase/WD40 repeat protein
MTAENSSEVTIFREARKIQCNNERAAFLDQACNENSELRKRIEKLLAAADKESLFLEEPASGLIENAEESQLSPTLLPTAESPAAVQLTDANQGVLRLMDATIADVPQVSLREEEQFDGPIQRPTSEEIPAQPVNSRYRLDAEIARGGMGAILRGRDVDIGRDLAIKVLLTSHKDRPEVVQRFIEEAQISGQLQHPGIAPVYDVGQFVDERPYMSMKLVKGDTLSKQLAERDNVQQDRSKLIGVFKQICDTMAYAHSRGVIHRDLKPANIMVGAFGEVQVMDWGLAKVLAVGGVADEKRAKQNYDGTSVIQTMRSSNHSSPAPIGSFGTAGGSGGSETQMGSVMGTPAYMPPEQALGEIDMLDQRADVFGLGAILAEILTGKPPYVGEDSTQIYRMASRGKLDDCFDRLDGCGADAELIGLAKQCLASEPADRLKDAGVLARQIAGYQQSVESKLRETEVQRASEATRVIEQRKRFRVALGLSTAALTILITGIVATAWQAREAKRQALVAQNANEKATQERDKARDAKRDAVVAKNAAEAARTAEQELKLQQQEIARQRRRELYASDMQLADQLYKGQNGEQKRIEQILASWIPVDDQEDLREFSWRYQWNRLQASADTVVPECNGVAITPAGKMVVTDTNGLHEVDENGKKYELINWTLEDPKSWFSPDGRWVAAKFDSGFDLYHIQSRTKVLSLPQKGKCSFSSNGKYFAAWNNGAKVDSLAPDEDAIPVWQLDGEKAQPIAPLVIGETKQLPATGDKLKLGNDGKSFLLLERPGASTPYFQVAAYLDGDPEPVLWRHWGTAICAWSPDGRIIASTEEGGGIDLRLTSDVAEKRTHLKLSISSHGKQSATPRFSLDGKLLVTAGSDGTIDLWDVSALADAARRFDMQQQEPSEEGDSGEPSIESVPLPRLVRTIKGVTNRIFDPDTALGVSANGGQLVAFALPLSGTAKRWNLDNVGGKYEVDNITEDLYGWTVSLDVRANEAFGRDWLIGKTRPDDIVKGNVDSTDRIAAVFDAEKGDWFTVSGPETWHGFFKRTKGSFGSLVRYQLENSDGEKHEVTLRRSRRDFGQSTQSGSVAFAPDGKNAILSDKSLGATQLNLKTNEAIRYPQTGFSSAYSPDGGLVAIDGAYAISIRDVESDTELYQLDTVINADSNPNTGAGILAFSPDGKFLAHVSFRSGSTRSGLNVWRTSDFKKIGGGPLDQEDFWMLSPVFSPDSSRLLVGDLRGRVQIWDTADWTQQETLQTSQQALISMAISSDGKRLVTGSARSGDGICVWDMETRKMLRKLSSPEVGWLTLSPDDRTLAVGCLNNNVVLWDLETGKQLQTIDAHSKAVGGVAFSNDGNRLATISLDGVLHVWDAASNAEIEQDPKTLSALLRLGLWRFEQERYEDAEALFSKVLELNRKSGRPIDLELERVGWKIRLTLQKTGRWPWQLRWESKFVGARLGEQATLSVQPIEGEWDYQWYCNYAPVEGATNPTLTLSNVTVDQIGTYQVKLAPPGYESAIFHLGGDAYVYDVSNPVIPGTLYCEVFDNITGGTVEDLTSFKRYRNSRCNYSRSLKAFEAPPNEIGSFGDNYGIRVTGFIKPPRTGEYVFYLASDDEGELYISSDESPDNLELVASVKRGPSGIGNECGRTNRRAWGANPSAVSKPIHLEAGKRYAIKALMKEDSGDEHISVTWQMPGDPGPKPGAPPIQGEYLEFEIK